MSGTDLMLANALVSALGWTLVHFLWQGCVIAAAFWLVCALSPRESAHLRYWAGIGGFVLSLAALLITFVVYYEPAAQFAVGPLAPESVNPFLVLSGSGPDSWALLQDGIEPALPVIVVIWMLGVAINTAQTVCGWVGVRRLLRSGDENIGAGLKTSADRLMTALGVKRTVRVLKSGLVSVPMAVGWLKPVILMPASVLVNLPNDQLEMIIAHELGHIRRNDYLLNFLQIVLETLLFYHPAIAWMSRRVREEREKCCDDLVVSRCGKPATYARALANLEVMRGPMTAAVMTATGGDLIGRIKRIIDTELPRSSSGYAQMTLLATVALVVALGAQQGMLLSRALNLVAGSAHLQSSDIEWKTWGQSRGAWSEGVTRFAGQNAIVLDLDREAKQSMESAAKLELASLNAQAQKQTHVAVPQLNASRQPPITGQGDLEVEREATRGKPSIESATLVNEQPGILPLVTEPGSQGRMTDFDPRQLAAVSPEAELEKPKPISQVSPKYPWRARKEGVEGFVELAFSLDSQGKVTDIEVLDAMPTDTFERAATKALK
ncbi:MAG TPA: TonB family protein, partial [Xanthomonadales bacterium]|nr:TonB family protein [Xanthomonadales bacterium]